MQIAILEPKDFSQKALNELSSMGFVEKYNNENLDEFLFNKEVLFIRLAYLIDKDFLIFDYESLLKIPKILNIRIPESIN